MSVVLYARVSTGQQAEKELSIPAQLRALRAYAAERKWNVAGEFQDVASGWSLTQRPGLSAALRLVRSGGVDHLLVHKADRLSRNTYQYLTIKGQLKTFGVNIVSVVERFEDNPMGEFIEHIMAAQAEFYSANLSFEVKKGLEERRRQGLSSGCVALGYIKENGKTRLDPARAEHIRHAFERWATGTAPTPQLADELFERGLVARHGKRLRPNTLCDILKNPFYIGVLRTSTGEYPGLHPQLISRELFARCQEVFRQKGTHGAKRQNHKFLLAGIAPCPKCGTTLVGEEHRKKSGKVFRYYRCHRQFCRFCVPTAEHEAIAVQQLLQLDMPGRCSAWLLAELRRQKRKRTEKQIAEVRSLRQRLRQLGDDKRQLVRRLAENLVTEEDFDRERKQLTDAERLTAWMLANKEHDVGDADISVVTKLALLDELKRFVAITDDVERRRVFAAFVQRVDFGRGQMLTLKSEWQRFDNSDKASSRRP